MKVDLFLRRTYHDHPRHEDDGKFWTVLHQGLTVGVIIQERGPSDEPPHWQWVIHMHAGRYANGVRHTMATDGRAATRDACLAPFRNAFERYLTFVGEEGWACHVQHMKWQKSRGEATRSRENRA